MTAAPRIRHSALARWVLLLALSAGMVLMHHIPGEHNAHHSPSPAATASATTGHQQHQPAHATLPATEHADLSAADQNTVEHGPVQLDDLLHLCLAIIAGAAALLLTRHWKRGSLLGRSAVRFSPPCPRDRRRRPPPVRRRLAELCVLRL